MVHCWAILVRDKNHFIFFTPVTVNKYSLFTFGTYCIILANSFFKNCSTCTARQGDRKWKKLLKVSGWCDKNGLDESFKMSPHLICLSWLSNFHIISRPDPEAGHKRDLRCQLRHIKWGLISKLSMNLFSWHPPKSWRSFFHFDSLSRPVNSGNPGLTLLVVQ